MSTPPIPKASLYYYPGSIWASVALLALEEKGYGPEEVDLKVVDLSKGENFAPSFLRLNPKATVPTLVVPLDKTLSSDIESRYKALTDSIAIAEFLDKSRSARSRTHTVSTAPAPSLSPATPAFLAASNSVIALLHSDALDPNSLFYLAARNPDQLAAATPAVLPFLEGRIAALDGFLAESERPEEDGGLHVTEKVKALWREKRLASVAFWEVFRYGTKSEAELDDAAKQRRKEYFEQAKKVWDGVKAPLVALNKEIIGPYVLGDQLSLADLHLAAWLSRVLQLVGSSVGDQGPLAIAKLESQVAPDGSLGLPKDFAVLPPQNTPTLDSTPSDSRPPVKVNKLAAFWDAIRERPSWAKIYEEGLH
ncbi:hypothetical protein PUNSTDRAFT_79578 [Punctularia strigosozonata HHB-11173 SS5]|uniref:uncharacterized protein n=1 Tax=Punctularia strigosozonata (strain HHB-11173) TaxID=741275 RepID=UPI00044179F2|nr:uncharacterized protein PUNSTDRAFT_79578 [Punctularia strigosozonata HHB-11173 SS5]EIN13777.1 hypothetical protein PUNSTDRAFT_79578 [Punctularia strigosozonata HHB-11173 SS5]